MKRLNAASLAIFLFLSLTVLVAPHASAATLPPKCDAVKTQILGFQDEEKPLADQYEPVNGKWSWFFATSHPEDFLALQKKIVDLQVKMFTYDKANLDCFTADQKDYATENYKKWKQIQKNLKAQPSWIAGFNFVAIVWDSIFDK